MTHPSMERHEREWLDALATLEEEGWRAEVTCWGFPVQVEGRAPDGQGFYFRARHGLVTLAVGDDPISSPRWEGEEEHPHAGFLPAGDGLAIIRRLYRQYGDQPNGRMSVLAS